MAPSLFNCFGFSSSTIGPVFSSRRGRCSSDDGLYDLTAPLNMAIGDDEVGIPFSIALKRQADAEATRTTVVNTTADIDFPSAERVQTTTTVQQVSSQQSSSSADDEYAAAETNSIKNGENHLRSLGILPNKPSRSDFVTYEARLGSFMASNWPAEHRTQKPVELAEAGLYYAGRGDCVKCFFCGGRLRHWQPNDDVWVEHARWYPRCAFVHNVKGRHFIEKAAACLKAKEEGLHATTSSSESSSSSSSSSGDDISNRSASRLSTPVSKTGDNSNGSSLKVPVQRGGGSSVLLKTPSCKICLDRDVCIAFLPCGHLAACAQCAPALRDCPICRAPILSTVRTYMV